MKKLLAGFSIAAAVFVFAACQQPASSDSGDIWDLTHSYGENRLTGKTVYSGTDPATASEKYEFQGNEYTVSMQIPGAGWTVLRKGTYVTNGFTRRVDFYQTQSHPMFYSSLDALQVFILDTNVLRSLSERVQNAVQNGTLVDDVAILDTVAPYFTEHPEQYAKLPATPWGGKNLGNPGASDADVNGWWTERLAATGYTDRKAYVRDHFVNLRAIPTSTRYYELQNSDPYF
jgi:hypothetical protein